MFCPRCRENAVTFVIIVQISNKIAGMLAYDMGFTLMLIFPEFAMISTLCEFLTPFVAQTVNFQYICT